MKDVRGSACFGNCETEFRYSRCIEKKNGKLVEGFTNIYKMMSVSLKINCGRVSESSIQFWSEWGLEWGKSEEGEEVGYQNSEDDSQTKDEGCGGIGGVQEEDAEGYDGHVEEDEITDDGREDRGKVVGRLCLGQVTMVTFQKKMKVSRSVLGWRTTTWWRNRIFWRE